MSNLNVSTSDNLLIEEVATVTADEVVDAIAETIPGINIAYNLAKAYMERGMKLRQRRVLEWVEFVRDNLGEFSRQLFDNEQFQDCFVLLIEAYIRERAETKRKLHQQILIGLTKLSEEDIEKSELEKNISVTNQISHKALYVLSFIKSELLEKVELDIREKLTAYKEKDGVEGIRLESETRDGIIISDYITKWIHERYSQNSEVVKTRYNLTKDTPIAVKNKITFEEHLKRKQLLGPMHELANLGLLVRKNGVATWGGNVGSGYSISEFGYQYMEYLDKSDNFETHHTH